MIPIYCFQPEHNLPMSPPSHSYIQASLSPGNASASTQIEETLLKVTPVAKPSVSPTPMRIGFLGLGIMGQGMVMNLLRSGHEVTVWNRTALKVSLFDCSFIPTMLYWPPGVCDFIGFGLPVLLP